MRARLAPVLAVLVPLLAVVSVTTLGPVLTGLLLGAAVVTWLQAFSSSGLGG